MLNKQIHTIIEFLHDHNSIDILVENIEIVKNTLTYNIQHKLSSITSQIKRTYSNFGLEQITYEIYDININKKLSAIILIIESLKRSDILVCFSYNNNHKIVYYFYDKNDKLMYEYKGDLIDGKPHGKGEIVYKNGERFIGRFENGKKHGKGEFYDSNGDLLKIGFWKNDKFIDKGIKYFDSIKVAASQDKGTIISSNDFQVFNLPKLNEEELIAFTIEGDSMKPKYYEGDVVVCKEITDFNELMNNRTYIIFYYDERTLEEKAYLKTVQLPNENSKKITLISINSEEHPPFDIYPNSKTKFYKVKAHISYED